MFCENCGSEIKTGDAFCSKCGNKVIEEVTVKMGYQSEYGSYSHESYEGERYSQEYPRKPYRSGEKSYDGGYRGRNRKKQQENKDNMLYVFLGILTVVLLAGIIWGAVTLIKLNKDEEPYDEPGSAVAEEIDPEIPEGVTTEKEVSVIPEETIDPEESEIIVTPEVTPLPTPIVTQPPATPVPTQPPVVYSNDYVIPDSSSRLLSYADLTGLGEWELRVARNEIYARHGRIFKDDALNSYFRSKSWYVPSIPADVFDDNNMLSKTELKNAKLITEYEKACGYN